MIKLKIKVIRFNNKKFDILTLQPNHSVNPYLLYKALNFALSVFSEEPKPVLLKFNKETCLIDDINIELQEKPVASLINDLETNDYLIVNKRLIKLCNDLSEQWKNIASFKTNDQEIIKKSVNKLIFATGLILIKKLDLFKVNVKYE